MNHTHKLTQLMASDSLIHFNMYYLFIYFMCIWMCTHIKGRGPMQELLLLHSVDSGIQTQVIRLMLIST